jgi:hypothetical protein
MYSIKNIAQISELKDLAKNSELKYLDKKKLKNTSSEPFIDKYTNKTFSEPTNKMDKSQTNNDSQKWFYENMIEEGKCVECFRMPNTTKTQQRLKKINDSIKEQHRLYLEYQNSKK